MKKLESLLEKLKKFNVNETLNKVCTMPDNELFILDEIRNRLETKGTNAKGEKLKTYKSKSPNVYSAFTMNLKQAEGQPTDKVTLKDTGEFHDSFSLKPAKNQFTITGDEDKPDGKISDNVDLKGVMDLSKDELKEVSDYIIKDLQLETRDQILQGI